MVLTLTPCAAKSPRCPIRRQTDDLFRNLPNAILISPFRCPHQVRSYTASPEAPDGRLATPQRLRRDRLERRLRRPGPPPRRSRLLRRPPPGPRPPPRRGRHPGDFPRPREQGRLPRPP